MILESIHTENFRNLEPAAVEFHPAVNIIVGRNGQGKTNLIEAVYFVATTKSFRTSRVASLFRFGAQSVFAAGAVDRDQVTRTISVGLESSESRKRILLINGERVTLPVYLRALTVFAYSAARLDIIGGAPEERRRFLDRGIASIDPAYLENLSRFTRVFKQRNALLGNRSTSSLDAWDEEFVATGEAVQTSRAAYAREIAASLEDIIATHRYHVTSVAIRYKPSVPDPRNRREELRAGMSLSGPQRDVLEFLVDGRPAAEVLSGGELKTIVLFLKFAKLAIFRRRFDEPPLFLLDDIDAELDLEILQRLLSKLPAATQVFATSAKEAFLQALQAGPHRRLLVENGRVSTARDFS
ncbi:MAG TPA: DNA replication and repair protein RecF [Thermoanaerobaculia bacterium]|nr:DNA replication and repair protein RecF [Thermoanaerobaculia bacterium]